MSDKISKRPPGLKHHTPSPHAESRTAAEKKEKKAKADVASTFGSVGTAISNFAQGTKNFIQETTQTAQRVTKAARVFAHTVKTTIVQPDISFAQSLEAGLADAAEAMTPRPDFLSLADEAEENLDMLRAEAAKHPELNPFIQIADAQYEAILASGLTCAVWDYQHDPDVTVKASAQRQTMDFADSLYRHRPIETNLDNLLVAYASVDRDVNRLRQIVTRNTDAIKNEFSVPEGTPVAEIFVPKPRSPLSPLVETPSDMITSFHVSDAQNARIANMYWEPLLQQTEARLIGVVDTAHIASKPFTHEAALGYLHKRIGNSEKAIQILKHARDIFRAYPKDPNEQEIADEINVLNDLAELHPTDDATARLMLGEAGGLIEWLAITQPDVATLHRIANMNAMLPINQREHAHELSTKGPADADAVERYHRAIDDDYREIIKTCIQSKTTTKQIRSIVHARILEFAAAQFEARLDAAMAQRLTGDKEEAHLSHITAENRFSHLRFEYELTAEPNLLNNAMGRMHWANATYTFKTGDVEQSLRDLTTISNQYPDTAMGRMMKNAPEDLWVRRYGIVDDHGNFSPHIGKPSEIAKWKVIADKLLDDKASAMKAMMGGAGVAVVGVALADIAFGEKVSGTFTLGQVGMIGAGTALVTERGYQVLAAQHEISAAYTTGIANVTPEELAQRGKALAAEVGICFLAGGAARYLRMGVMTLGAEVEAPLLRGLLGEAGYVAEGVGFHTYSGMIRGQIDRSPMGFFKSIMTLRLLGAGNEANLASLVFPKERWADAVMRHSMNTAIANVPLQTMEGLLAGNLGNFGPGYFDSLFDLYAISVGGKVPEAITNSPAIMARAKAMHQERTVQKLFLQVGRLTTTEGNIQSDLQYAETEKDQVALTQKLVTTLKARVAALNELARLGVVDANEANAYNAGITHFIEGAEANIQRQRPSATRREATTEPHTLSTARKFAKGVARYGKISVMGPAIIAMGAVGGPSGKTSKSRTPRVANGKLHLSEVEQKTTQRLIASGAITRATLDDMATYAHIPGATEKFKEYLKKSETTDDVTTRVRIGRLLFKLSRIHTFATLLNRPAIPFRSRHVIVPEYDRYGNGTTVKEALNPSIKPHEHSANARIDIDVPVIDGHIWELKHYPETDIGNNITSYNQLLRIQKAIEVGQAAKARGKFNSDIHVDGATIEISGNVSQDYIFFANHRAPDVEILYALKLPDGHEVVFPIKEAANGVRSLMRIQPNTELSAAEKVIVLGIKHRIETGEMKEVLSSKLLTAEDIQGSPYAQSLAATMTGGRVDPSKITDIHTLNEFEKLSNAKRLKLFRESGEAPITHRTMHIYSHEITDRVVDHELDKIEAYFANATPELSKRYLISETDSPDVYHAVRRVFIEKLKKIAAFEQEREQHEPASMGQRRRELGYSGPKEGYPLDPLHVYMDSCREVLKFSSLPNDGSYAVVDSFPTAEQIVLDIQSGKYQNARHKVAIHYPAGTREDISVTRTFDVTGKEGEHKRLLSDVFNFNFSTFSKLRESETAPPEVHVLLEKQAKRIERAHTQLLKVYADRDEAVQEAPVDQKKSVSTSYYRRIEAVKRHILRTYENVLGKHWYNALSVRILSDETDNLTKFIYVVDANGTMRMYEEALIPRGTIRPTHGVLAGGRNVYAAGEVFVRGLQVVTINNGSGHYRPDARENLQYVRNLLAEKGFQVSDGADGQHPTSLQHIHFPFITIESPVGELWRNNFFTVVAETRIPTYFKSHLQKTFPTARGVNLEQAINKHPLRAATSIYDKLAEHLHWAEYVGDTGNANIADFVTENAVMLKRLLDALNEFPPHIRPEGFEAGISNLECYLRALDKNPLYHDQLHIALKELDRRFGSHFMNVLNDGHATPDTKAATKPPAYDPNKTRVTRLAGSAAKPKATLSDIPEPVVKLIRRYTHDWDPATTTPETTHKAIGKVLEHMVALIEMSSRLSSARLRHLEPQLRGLPQNLGIMLDAIDTLPPESHPGTEPGELTSVGYLRMLANDPHRRAQLGVALKALDDHARFAHRKHTDYSTRYASLVDSDVMPEEAARERRVALEHVDSHIAGRPEAEQAVAIVDTVMGQLVQGAEYENMAADQPLGKLIAAIQAGNVPPAMRTEFEKLHQRLRYGIAIANIVGDQSAGAMATPAGSQLVYALYGSLRQRFAAVSTLYDVLEMAIDTPELGKDPAFLADLFKSLSNLNVTDTTVRTGFDQFAREFDKYLNAKQKPSMGYFRDFPWPPDPAHPLVAAGYRFLGRENPAAVELDFQDQEPPTPPPSARPVTRSTSIDLWKEFNGDTEAITQFVFEAWAQGSFPINPDTHAPFTNESLAIYLRRRKKNERIPAPRLTMPPKSARLAVELADPAHRAKAHAINVEIITKGDPQLLAEHGVVYTFNAGLGTISGVNAATNYFVLGVDPTSGAIRTWVNKSIGAPKPTLVAVDVRFFEPGSHPLFSALYYKYHNQGVQDSDPIPPKVMQVFQDEFTKRCVGTAHPGLATWFNYISTHPLTFGEVFKDRVVSVRSERAPKVIEAELQQSLVGQVVATVHKGTPPSGPKTPPDSGNRDTTVYMSVKGQRTSGTIRAKDLRKGIVFEEFTIGIDDAGKPITLKLPIATTADFDHREHARNERHDPLLAFIAGKLFVDVPRDHPNYRTQNHVLDAMQTLATTIGKRWDAAKTPKEKADVKADWVRLSAVFMEMFEIAAQSATDAEQSVAKAGSNATETMITQAKIRRTAAKLILDEMQRGKWVEVTAKIDLEDRKNRVMDQAADEVLGPTYQSPRANDPYQGFEEMTAAQATAHAERLRDRFDNKSSDAAARAVVAFDKLVQLGKLSPETIQGAARDVAGVITQDAGMVFDPAPLSMPHFMRNFFKLSAPDSQLSLSEQRKNWANEIETEWFKRAPAQIVETPQSAAEPGELGFDQPMSDVDTVQDLERPNLTLEPPITVITDPAAREAAWHEARGTVDTALSHNDLPSPEHEHERRIDHAAFDTLMHRLDPDYHQMNAFVGYTPISHPKHEGPFTGDAKARIEHDLEWLHRTYPTQFPPHLLIALESELNDKRALSRISMINVGANPIGLYFLFDKHPLPSSMPFSYIREDHHDEILNAAFRTFNMSRGGKTLAIEIHITPTQVIEFLKLHPGAIDPNNNFLCINNTGLTAFRDFIFARNIPVHIMVPADVRDLDVVRLARHPNIHVQFLSPRDLSLSPEDQGAKWVEETSLGTVKPSPFEQWMTETPVSEQGHAGNDTFTHDTPMGPIKDAIERALHSGKKVVQVLVLGPSDAPLARQLKTQFGSRVRIDGMASQTDYDLVLSADGDPFHSTDPMTALHNAVDHLAIGGEAVIAIPEGSDLRGTLPKTDPVLTAVMRALGIEIIAKNAFSGNLPLLVYVKRTGPGTLKAITERAAPIASEIAKLIQLHPKTDSTTEGMEFVHTTAALVGRNHGLTIQVGYRVQYNGPLRTDWKSLAGDIGVHIYRLLHDHHIDITDIQRTEAFQRKIDFFIDSITKREILQGLPVEAAIERSKKSIIDSFSPSHPELPADLGEPAAGDKATTPTDTPLGIVGLNQEMEYPDSPNLQRPRTEVDRVTHPEYRKILTDYFPTPLFTDTESLARHDEILQTLLTEETRIGAQRNDSLRTDHTIQEFTRHETDAFLARTHARSQAFTNLLELRTQVQLRAKFGADTTLTDMDLEAERNRILTTVLSEAMGAKLPIARGQIRISSDDGVVVLRPTSIKDYAAIEHALHGKKLTTETSSGGFCCHISALGIPFIVINPEMGHSAWVILRHEMQHLRKYISDRYEPRTTPSEVFFARAKGEVFSFLMEGASPQETIFNLTKSGNSYDYIGNAHKVGALTIDKKTLTTLQHAHRTLVTHNVWFIHKAVVALVAYGYHPEAARQAMVEQLTHVPFDQWENEIPKIVKDLRSKPPERAAPPMAAPDAHRAELMHWMEAELQNPNIALDRLQELRRRFQSTDNDLQQTLEVLQFMADERDARAEAKKPFDGAPHAKKTVSLFLRTQQKQLDTALSGLVTTIQNRIDRLLLIRTAHSKQLLREKADRVLSGDDHVSPLPPIRATDVMPLKDRLTHLRTLRDVIERAKSSDDVEKAIALYTTFIQHSDFPVEVLRTETAALKQIAARHPEWEPQLETALRELPHPATPLDGLRQMADEAEPPELVLPTFEGAREKKIPEFTTPAEYQDILRHHFPTASQKVLDKLAAAEKTLAEMQHRLVSEIVEQNRTPFNNAMRLFQTGEISETDFIERLYTISEQQQRAVSAARDAALGSTPSASLTEAYRAATKGVSISSGDCLQILHSLAHVQRTRMRSQAYMELLRGDPEAKSNPNVVLASNLSKGFGKVVPIPQGHVEISNHDGVIVLRPELEDDYRAFFAAADTPTESVGNGFITSLSALGIPIIVINPKGLNNWIVYVHELQHLWKYGSNLDERGAVEWSNFERRMKHHQDSLIGKEGQLSQKTWNRYCDLLHNFLLSAAKDEVLAYVTHGSGPNGLIEKLTRVNGPYDYINDTSATRLKQLEAHFGESGIQHLFGGRDQFQSWLQLETQRIRETYNKSIADNVRKLFDVLDKLIQAGYHPETARRALVDALTLVPLEMWPNTLKRLEERLLNSAPVRTPPASTRLADQRPTLRTWWEAQLQTTARVKPHQVPELAYMKAEVDIDAFATEHAHDGQLPQLVDVLNLLHLEAETRVQTLEHRQAKHPSARIEKELMAARGAASLYKHNLDYAEKKLQGKATPKPEDVTPTERSAIPMVGGAALMADMSAGLHDVVSSVTDTLGAHPYAVGFSAVAFAGAVAGTRLFISKFTQEGRLKAVIKTLGIEDLIRTKSPAPNDPIASLNAFLRGTLGREPTLAETRAFEKGTSQHLERSAIYGEGKNPPVPPIYQVYNKEFVDTLAARLTATAQEFRKKHGRDPVIVEIAAGDGRLTRALRTRGIAITATDNQTWGAQHTGDVMNKGMITAIRHADIIIGSWVPPALNYINDNFDVPIAQHLIEYPEKTYIQIEENATNTDNFRLFVNRAREKGTLSIEEPSEFKGLLTSRSVTTSHLLIYHGVVKEQPRWMRDAKPPPTTQDIPDVPPPPHIAADPAAAQSWRESIATIQSEGTVKALETIDTLIEYGLRDDALVMIRALLECGRALIDRGEKARLPLKAGVYDIHTAMEFDNYDTFAARLKRLYHIDAAEWEKVTGNPPPEPVKPAVPVVEPISPHILPALVEVIGTDNAVKLTKTLRDDYLQSIALWFKTYSNEGLSLDLDPAILVERLSHASHPMSDHGLGGIGAYKDLINSLPRELRARMIACGLMNKRHMDTLSAAGVLKRPNVASELAAVASLMSEFAMDDNVGVVRSYGYVTDKATEYGIALTPDELHYLVRDDAYIHSDAIHTNILGAMTAKEAFTAQIRRYHILVDGFHLKPDRIPIGDFSTTRINDTYSLRIGTGDIESTCGFNFELYADGTPIATLGINFTDTTIDVVRYQGSNATTSKTKDFKAFSGGVDPLPWFATAVGKMLLAQATASGKTLRFISGNRIHYSYPHREGHGSDLVRTIDDGRTFWTNPPKAMLAMNARHDTMVQERETAQAQHAALLNEPETPAHRQELIRLGGLISRLNLEYDKIHDIVVAYRKGPRIETLYDTTAQNLGFRRKGQTAAWHRYQKDSAGFGATVRGRADNTAQLDRSLQVAEQAFATLPKFAEPQVATTIRYEPPQRKTPPNHTTYDLNGRRPSLVDTIPGLTTEIETAFSNGAFVLETSPGKFSGRFWPDPESGQQDIDPQIGAPLAKTYAAWATSASFPYTQPEISQKAREQLESELEPYGITLTPHRTIPAAHYKLLSGLVAMLPRSLLESGVIKTINPYRGQGGGLYSDEAGLFTDDGELSVFNAPVNLTRAGKAFMFMHEAGHGVEKTLTTEQRPRLEAAWNAIVSTQTGAIIPDSAQTIAMGGVANRRLSKINTFSEFIAETNAVYTLAGPYLRQEIKAMRDPKARAAYEQVYNFFKQIYGGHEFGDPTLTSTADYDSSGRIPTLVGTIPGLTPELEMLFKNGAYIIKDGDRYNGQYIPNPDASYQDVDAKTGEPLARIYNEWLARAGFQRLPDEEHQRAEDQLTSDLARYGITVSATRVPPATQYQLLSELIAMCPRSILESGIIKKIRIGQDQSGYHGDESGLFMDGQLTIFRSPLNITRAGMAFIFLHEVGHAVEESLTPDQRTHLSSALQTIIKAKAGPIIPESTAALAMGGIDKRRNHKIKQFDEFISETHATYILAGSYLRQEISKIQDSEARAAYESVYAFFKQLHGGREFGTIEDKSPPPLDPGEGGTSSAENVGTHAAQGAWNTVVDAAHGDTHFGETAEMGPAHFMMGTMEEPRFSIPEKLLDAIRENTPWAHQGLDIAKASAQHPQKAIQAINEKFGNLLNAAQLIDFEGLEDEGRKAITIIYTLLTLLHHLPESMRPRGQALNIPMEAAYLRALHAIPAYRDALELVIALIDREHGTTYGEMMGTEVN